MPDSPATLADTVEVGALLSVLARLREGDFTARMPLDWTGVAGKVADGLNDLIVANQDVPHRARPREPGRRQAGPALAAARARPDPQVGGVDASTRSTA